MFASLVVSHHMMPPSEYNTTIIYYGTGTPPQSAPTPYLSHFRHNGLATSHMFIYTQLKDIFKVLWRNSHYWRSPFIECIVTTRHLLFERRGGVSNIWWNDRWHQTREDASNQLLLASLTSGMAGMM